MFATPLRHQNHECESRAMDGANEGLVIIKVDNDKQPRCLNCGQLYESAAVLETHRSSAAVTCGACNEEFKSYCALGNNLCASAK